MYTLKVTSNIFLYIHWHLNKHCSQQIKSLTKNYHPQKFLTWINWRLLRIISSNQLSINMKHYLYTKIFVVCCDLIGRDAKVRNFIVRTDIIIFCLKFNVNFTASFDELCWSNEMMINVALFSNIILQELTTTTIIIILGKLHEISLERKNQERENSDYLEAREVYWSSS